MGNAQSDPGHNNDTVKGHWVHDVKTGMRWATDPIVSDASVKKLKLPSIKDAVASGEQTREQLPSRFRLLYSLPMLPGEVWGPYTKMYTINSFGQKVFTPPESVDGIPILCRCRDIHTYVRASDGSRMFSAEWALVAGGSPPACWEDDTSIWNPYGGSEFYVVIRHPAFYESMVSNEGIIGLAKNLLGGSKRKMHKRTRKVKRAKRRSRRI
jgi:hypothetical protein